MQYKEYKVKNHRNFLVEGRGLKSIMIQIITFGKKIVSNFVLVISRHLRQKEMISPFYRVSRLRIICSGLK